MQISLKEQLINGEIDELYGHWKIYLSVTEHVYS